VTLSFVPLAMAGLLSPKPIPYNMQHPNGQFTNYGRGLSTFSETPPLPASSAQGQFSDNNSPHNNLAIQEDEKIYGLVIDLMDSNTREGALLELSKKREQYDDLALVLWHSFGELYLRSDF
jgi:CCR4-NOT transcription complex subunit 9